MPELLSKQEKEYSDISTVRILTKIRRSIHKGDSDRTIRSQNIAQVALNPIKIQSKICRDFTARPGSQQAPSISTRIDRAIYLNRANIFLDCDDFIVRELKGGKCSARTI